MKKFVKQLNILNAFAKLIPGGTYKKKLFYWNLIQFIFTLILAFAAWNYTVESMKNMGNAVLNNQTISFSDFSVFWFYIATSEFFTMDSHIWGDFYWGFTGIDLRSLIWFFIAYPLTLIITYFWAYKNSKIAKLLRTGSFIVALSAYLAYTIFFTFDPRYDYFVWLFILNNMGWGVLPVIMAILSVAAMWFGVIISNGYLIYKAWKEN